MKQNKILGWEAHLIKRASAGEKVAFELLADLYRPTLHSIAMRMLRNREDANDALQDTLIKAWRAIGDFDPKRPIKPWFCRICANCCVDIVRDRKRSTEDLDKYEFALADSGSSPHDLAEDAIFGEEVQDAIARLPKPYQEIVLMRHYRQMDVNEIALALNRPEGTIKSWLFRARNLLKQDLGVALG